MVDEATMQKGLLEIRLGNLLTSAARAVLTHYIELLRKTFPLRFLPPGSVAHPRASAEELALKRQIELSLRACRLGWDGFQSVLTAIRYQLFSGGMVEMLPVVVELGERYSLDGCTVWQCVTNLSAKFPDTYGPLRKLFQAATEADRPAFIWLLQAEYLLQFGRGRDVMVLSHCDKWPACEALIEELKQQL